jgi:undecaprenyl-diphosphatase
VESRRVRTIAAVIALVVGLAVSLIPRDTQRSDSTATSDTGGRAVLVREGPEMSVGQAVVLGLVEGITEYLPVSSTGHLLIAERAMNMDDPAKKDALDTYTVVIQIGAILAVLGIYRRRVAMLFAALFGRSADGRKLLTSLVISFVPAAVIGVLGESIISDRLLKPWPVVAAWIVGGIALITLWPRVAKRPSSADSILSITPRQALLIGLMQSIAMWPGTSRSFVTILGGVLIGLSLAAAVEYAFLLGLITLSAATLFSLAKDGTTLVDTYGFRSPAIGIVVAGIAAFATVKWMVGFLNKRGLAPFGWYRIAAGVIVGGLLITGVI